VDGTLTPTEEHLQLIRHIAFSSIPRSRRQLLRAVLTNNGEITSPKAEEVLSLCRPAVRRSMKELAATGLVEHSGGSRSEPDRIVLARKWRWLLVDNEEFDETGVQLCRPEEIECML
jgi:predicted ArsR family transcriptional regulator